MTDARHIHSFLSGLLVLMMLFSCTNRGNNACREFEGLTLESSILGREMQYSVVLPEGYYSSREDYPVLYVFHCIGGDYTTGIEYCDITHVADSLVTGKQIKPFIIVMPDVFLSYCADTYDGIFRYESMLLDELIPRIEKDYRTNGKRFTLGFSMGGFGAMSVAMRHTDMFLGVAALSPSVRTDAQYASEEPQEGWENQWGRIFGGIGLTGEDRITPYYKQHCPLHLASSMQMEAFDHFHIFLDSGNREGGSLAESNEALHLALAARGIPHIWRVRDGGHDFAFWRQALPDAMRFASCTFEGGKYAPAKMREPARKHYKGSPILFEQGRIYLPGLDYVSGRKFPAVYVFGAGKEKEKDIVEYYTAMFHKGAASPVAFCFVDNDFETAVAGAEASCPALRSSQRMRSAICFGDAAGHIQPVLCGENLFTNVVFAEASGTMPAEEFAAAIRQQKRYPKFILAAGADSPEYSRNSSLHVALKNAKLSHTHYAYETGSGELLWHFPEWMKAINYKFHD